MGKGPVGRPSASAMAPNSAVSVSPTRAVPEMVGALAERAVTVAVAGKAALVSISVVLAGMLSAL